MTYVTYREIKSALFVPACKDILFETTVIFSIMVLPKVTTNNHTLERTTRTSSAIVKT